MSYSSLYSALSYTCIQLPAMLRLLTLPVKSILFSDSPRLWTVPRWSWCRPTASSGPWGHWGSRCGRRGAPWCGRTLSRSRQAISRAARWWGWPWEPSCTAGRKEELGLQRGEWENMHMAIIVGKKLIKIISFENRSQQRVKWTYV